MEGWVVKTYDKQGNRVAEIKKDNELECAKLCIARLRNGYPAPTVWHNGKRVAGY